MSEFSHSGRRTISSFVDGAGFSNNMRTKQNPFRNSPQSQIIEPFGFSGDDAQSNLIGDYIHMQNGPRAVSVSATGVKSTLQIGEEEQVEIAPKKEEVYSDCPAGDADTREEPHRKRRSKSTKNYSNRISQKGRRCGTSRSCTSLNSISNANTASQTLPMAQPHENVLSPRDLTLSHQLYSFRNELAPSAQNKKTSIMRNISADIPRLFILLATITITFWITCAFFKLKGIQEIVEVTVNKIRNLGVTPEAPKSKFDILKDILSKLFL